MSRPAKHGRPSPEDEALRLAVEGALATLSLEALVVHIVDGVVHVGGQVASAQMRREAEARALSVPGIGKVVNEIQVVAAEYLEPTFASAEDQTDVSALTFQRPAEREGPEPDFTDDIGSESMAESAGEAEPFFPATDTVVKPRKRTDEGVEWVGGFAPTADTLPLEPEAHPRRQQLEDSEIAEDVRLALEEDAATTDLDIHVHVRRGIVYLRGVVSTIEDVEAAETAASRVPGVIEVREELQLG